MYEHDDNKFVHPPAHSYSSSMVNKKNTLWRHACLAHSASVSGNLLQRGLNLYIRFFFISNNSVISCFGFSVPLKQQISYCDESFVTVCALSCYIDDLRCKQWLQSLLNDIYVSVVYVIMMTSSNGKISALLAICAGNSPVLGEFPTQRPVTRSFDFFYPHPNKRLSKQ